ncbi:MAG: HAD-IA family hydrolase, partial [Candidatus Levybacteria bacterium]|nr:HAD-IA family hydrolase [Candidatus Levybacteria bacterium]
AKKTINYLKSKKITIVLATSSSRSAVNKFINKFHLSNAFSLIITKDDVTKRKPDPQIYNLAKEKINLKDEEILVVEDTQIGVEASKSAGLICVAIPNKYTENQDFSKVDYILGSLEELLNIFPH